MSSAEPPSGTFTVLELNRLIRYALSVTFPDEVWVEGEISSLSRHASSGHVYFQLIDADSDATAADAALHVVLFRTNKEFVNRVLKRASPTGAMKMDDGVRIRIRGSLDYFPRQGRLQLRMTSIDPTYTLGRLAAERDRVLGALAVEGLLDANRRRPFPILPTRLGLVTSDGSAAHADFLDELRRSAIGWHIALASARVQGPGADVAIVAALHALVAHRVEVIAIVRGGGARTDLMTFDSELLARTIAGLPVPVVTGIGHEIDTTVADAVASLAYKTPTACAAGLVSHAEQAVDRAERAWQGIIDLAPVRVEVADQTIDAIGRRVATASRLRLDGHAQRLESNRRRLGRAGPTVLAAAGHRLDAQAWRVTALDPQRALARGWSITHTTKGMVVRDPDMVEPDDELITTIAGGTVRSRVTDTASPGPSDRP